MQLQVKLVAPHRQPGRQRLEVSQITPQAAVMLGSSFSLLLPEPQLLEHFSTGASTVVAHSGQPQGRINPGRALPSQAIALHRHGIAIGADRGVDQGQQLGTAAAAPAKQPVGEGIGGIPGHFVGAKPTHAGAASHGRQAAGETKAVGQPGQIVLQLREASGAELLAQLKLAQQ